MLSKHRKIVIVSPRQKWGGAIVLHLLCKLLIEKGYDAKIFLSGIHLQKNESNARFWFRWIKYTVKDTIIAVLSELLKHTRFANDVRFKGYLYKPVRGYKRKYFPFISSDTIVVYSEVYYGNFLNSKNIVRWLLYHNSYANDTSAYSDNELFFSYREVFNDVNLNPEKRTLRLTNFDYDLYRQTNFGERSGKCYMIRKGKQRNDLPSDFDGPILDDLSEQEIVANFNKYRFCYFYDTQTFYSRIASVCGCIPIIVCENGKSRSDYLGNGDGGYGIAYNDTAEEIDFAIRTRDKGLERINHYKIANNESIDAFLKECGEYFDKKVNQ